MLVRDPDNEQMNEEIGAEQSEYVQKNLNKVMKHLQTLR